MLASRLPEATFPVQVMCTEIARNTSVYSCSAKSPQVHIYESRTILYKYIYYILIYNIYTYILYIHFLRFSPPSFPHIRKH